MSQHWNVIVEQKFGLCFSFVCWVFWYVSLSASTVHSSPFFFQLLICIQKLDRLIFASQGLQQLQLQEAEAGLGRFAWGPCAQQLPGTARGDTLTPASCFWSPWWDGVAVEDPHFGTHSDVSHLGFYFTSCDFLSSCLSLCYSNPGVKRSAGAQLGVPYSLWCALIAWKPPTTSSG